MATKKSENPVINIPAMQIQTFDLKIVGDSPFICHAWSEKAKEFKKKYKQLTELASVFAEIDKLQGIA